MKMSDCGVDESKLFYFEMSASITGEICRTCEDLYGIESDLISRSGPRIVGGVQQVCEALDKARR